MKWNEIGNLRRFTYLLEKNIPIQKQPIQSREVHFLDTNSVCPLSFPDMRQLKPYTITNKLTILWREKRILGQLRR